MVDRRTRDRLAELLECALRGEVVSLESMRPTHRWWDVGAGAVHGCAHAALSRSENGHPPDSPVFDGRVRSELERCILFLKSDREYRWDRCDLIVTASVLFIIIGAGIVAFTEQSGSRMFAALSVVSIVAVPLGIYWLFCRIRGMNRRYWPFYGRRDYENSVDESLRGGRS